MKKENNTNVKKKENFKKNIIIGIRFFFVDVFFSFFLLFYILKYFQIIPENVNQNKLFTISFLSTISYFIFLLIMFFFDCLISSYYFK